MSLWWSVPKTTFVIAMLLSIGGILFLFADWFLGQLKNRRDWKKDHLSIFASRAFFFFLVFEGIGIAFSWRTHILEDRAASAWQENSNRDGKTIEQQHKQILDLKSQTEQAKKGAGDANEQLADLKQPRSVPPGAAESIGRMFRGVDPAVMKKVSTIWVVYNRADIDGNAYANNLLNAFDLAFQTLPYEPDMSVGSDAMFGFCPPGIQVCLDKKSDLKFTRFASSIAISINSALTEIGANPSGVTDDEKAPVGTILIRVGAKPFPAGN